MVTCYHTLLYVNNLGSFDWVSNVFGLCHICDKFLFLTPWSYMPLSQKLCKVRTSSGFAYLKCGVNFVNLTLSFGKLGKKTMITIDNVSIQAKHPFSLVWSFLFVI